MKLSTKSTYGLRAMVHLALRDSEGVISLAEISRNEHISLTYLEQLFSKLRRQGLIRSSRGPKGGYALARKPRNISVGEIVRVLEEETAPVFCVGRDNKKACKRENGCGTRIVWQRLADAINNVLDSTNLEDLIRPVNFAEMRTR